MESSNWGAGATSMTNAIHMETLLSIPGSSGVLCNPKCGLKVSTCADEQRQGLMDVQAKCSSHLTVGSHAAYDQ